MARPEVSSSTAATSDVPGEEKNTGAGVHTPGGGLEEGWPRSAEFLHGVDLYNGGFYWEAHEQWEELWRATRRQSAEHQLIKGLIQSAAAVLKAAVEQRAGAISLAMSASEHLRAGASGLDLDSLGFSPALFATELVRWAHAVAEGRPATAPPLQIDRA